MRFKNHTKLPDELLREIIRFVCPSGISGFDITFKNCAGGFRGRAYVEGTNYHIVKNRRPAYIVIGNAINPAKDGRVAANPRKQQSRLRRQARGYMPWDAYTPEEAVVHLVAHELRHLWQRKVKRGYRVWGARGQYSERDADAYGISMTRQWRRQIRKTYA